MKSNITGNIRLTAEMRDRIVGEIKASGKTQKEFAALIPINDKYFSAILNGRKDIIDDILKKIAEILEVRKEYLLCQDNYRTDTELIAITGITDRLNYHTMIDFLDVLGIDVEIIPPEKIDTVYIKSDEEIYNVDGIPIPLKQLHFHLKNKDTVTLDAINALTDTSLLYRTSTYFKFTDRKTGQDYFVTPKTAATVFDMIKKSSYTIMSALLETSPYMDSLGRLQ